MAKVEDKEKRQEVVEVKHSMHGFFKDALKALWNDEKGKNVAEAEGDAAEALPFRLEKYDVVPRWYNTAVMVESAVKSGEAIPDWARSYPFFPIEGAGLGLGITSASTSKSKWAKQAYNDDTADGAALRAEVVKAIEASPDCIKFGAVVIFPNTVINAAAYHIAQKTYSDRNTYMTVHDWRLAQQFYDLDQNGRLVFNPNRKDGVVVGSVNRPFDVILGSVDDVDSSLIEKRFHVGDREDFFKSRILPEITGKNVVQIAQGTAQSAERGKWEDPSKMVASYNRIQNTLKGDNKNPNYNDFGAFFASKGVPSVKSAEDVEKCHEIFLGLSDQEFKDFFLDYCLKSERARTYAWFPIDRSAHEKDIRIAELAASSEIFNLGKEVKLSLSESVSVAEAGSSGEGFSITNIQEGFVDMLMRTFAHPTPNMMRTFVVDREMKLLSLNNVVLSQEDSEKGFIRMFVRFDEAERKTLNFKPVFKMYSSVLEPSAHQTFAVLRVKGTLEGFHVNAEIEKNGMDNVGIRHGDSTEAVYDLYWKGQSKGRKGKAASSGFDVTFMVPTSKSVDFSDPKSYFFFIRYAVDDAVKTTEDLPPYWEDEKVDAVMSLATDSEFMKKSEIWYNNVLEKTASHKGDIYHN